MELDFLVDNDIRIRHYKYLETIGYGYQWSSQLLYHTQSQKLFIVKKTVLTVDDSVLSSFNSEINTEFNKRIYIDRDSTIGKEMTILRSLSYSSIIQFHDAFCTLSDEANYEAYLGKYIV